MSLLPEWIRMIMWSVQDAKSSWRSLEKILKLGMVGSYEAEFVDTVDNVISIHRVPSENDEN